MTILVLVKDLVLSSQIRTACEAASIEYVSGRSNEKFLHNLQALSPEKVVIDLNVEGVDPIQAIQDAKKVLANDKIICFYSHVDIEAAEKAMYAGVDNSQIYKRSQFFSNLQEVLSA